MRKHGFTLIETLIVLAIIALVVAISIQVLFENNDVHTGRILFKDHIPAQIKPYKAESWQVTIQGYGSNHQLKERTFTMTHDEYNGVEVGETIHVH